MRAALERALLARWHGRPGLLWLGWPLAWLYGRVAAARASRVIRERSSVPVIVVGNITVGGSGKTPLVLALLAALRERGYRPGVIARGYGGTGPFPLHVGADTPAACAGDEPALVARTAGVPVVVDPQRARALAAIRARGVDVVVSDDGLQHLGLPRSVEIVVIDDRRRLGNGHCLPLGPLREPASRLASVDFVVGNGGDAGLGALPMMLRPTRFVSLGEPVQTMDVASFREVHGERIAAVAGIGDPARFFSTLRALDFTVEEHAFPDHHAYTAGDFAPLAGRVVVMTAKDAVKCRGIAGPAAWQLEVEAELPPGFVEQVLARAGLPARAGRKLDAQE